MKNDIWVVGDIQGCYEQFQQLLMHPEIIGKSLTKFWFVGDLINRGPQSLETLRYIINYLDSRSISVLGNHDLHLLVLAADIHKKSKLDTIDSILSASDSNDLINWLRFRPLAHFEHNHLMVHAGILPEWDISKTLSLAAEVQNLLRSPNWKKNLKRIYGNEPTDWKDSYTGIQRMRVIINALTRIRFCEINGHMNFSNKNNILDYQSKNLIPWFKILNSSIISNKTTILFGHWSALGLLMQRNVICLDTGCVWGRYLTAMRLHDRKLIQIPNSNR